MTLQQLRFLQAIVDNGYSVSRAAQALNTTQPGVSKTVRMLEREIGVPLFVRQANRFVGLTERGSVAVELARRVLRDTHAMLTLADEAAAASEGVLRLGTTHIHARYVLAPVIKRFVAQFPKVELVLSQGAPAQILAWVTEGAIDLGLSTLPAQVPADIGTLPAYPLARCLIVPAGHPLQRGGPVAMERIARYPLIAYHESFSTGWVMQRDFQRRGLQPRVVARATDASVVKAYVDAGIGIAVIPSLAVNRKQDSGVRIVRTAEPLPSSATLFSARKDHLLRAFAYEFIAMVAPERTPDAARAVFRGSVDRA
jgi:LysR family cys regulon transcriptional activator